MAVPNIGFGMVPTGNIPRAIFPGIQNFYNQAYNSAYQSFEYHAQVIMEYLGAFDRWLHAPFSSKIHEPMQEIKSCPAFNYSNREYSGSNQLANIGLQQAMMNQQLQSLSYSSCTTSSNIIVGAWADPRAIFGGY